MKEFDEICKYLFEKTEGIVIQEKCCVAYYNPGICEKCVKMDDEEAELIHINHTKDCICDDDDMDMKSLFKIVSKVMSEKGRREEEKKIFGDGSNDIG